MHDKKDEPKKKAKKGTKEYGHLAKALGTLKGKKNMPPWAKAE